VVTEKVDFGLFCPFFAIAGTQKVNTFSPSIVQQSDSPLYYLLTDAIFTLFGQKTT